MKLRPWSIPLLCGVLVGCGKDVERGEGVFTTRTPNVAAPQVETAPAVADVVVGNGKPPLDAQALREKLKLLAVKSECLRRGNAPAEEVASTMLALYKTHEIDLDTYAREMGRLGGDAAFQAAVQAELGNCPESALAGVAEAADVNDESDDVAVTAGMDSAGSGPRADDADEGEADDGPVAGGLDTSDSGGAVELADVVEAAAVADPAPATVDKTAPDWSGTWTGALKGSVSGTLRVTIRGRNVSSATMSWGGKSVRLQGTVASNGHLALGGRINNADFVRLRGRINSAGKALSGTWDGVIDRKRVQGTLTLSR